MITDAVLDLIEAGVVHQPVQARDTAVTVTGAALGSKPLFDALGEREDVCSPRELHPLRADAGERRAAVPDQQRGRDRPTAAGELRVRGRARCSARRRQVDFLRAASASGGAAILAAVRHGDRAELSGPVSSAQRRRLGRTEHGARSLRALSDAQRAEAC